MRRATITGWGRCTPQPVLTNDDLASVVETSDEWITARSGIKERRIAHVENSEMSTVAGKHALAAAGLEAADIDYLLVATCTPDRQIPSNACYIQAKLGAVNAAASDINAGCTGFLYGLNMANGLIATGAAKRVLLIGSEKISPYLDFDERSTAVLFGDGAGAVVLEAAEGDEGILAITNGSDGTLSEVLTASGVGTEFIGAPAPIRIVMEGQAVFKAAVTEMGAAASKVIEEAGWAADDVDLLIPHQANIRIIDATARRLQFDPAKVYTNVASYGNTSAASIPIALSEALDEARLPAGGKLVLVAFGAGLTWGAAAIEWGERVDRIGTSDAVLPEPDRTALEILRERQVAKAL